jgi:hypothetical protein
LVSPIPRHSLGLMGYICFPLDEVISGGNADPSSPRSSLETGSQVYRRMIAAAVDQGCDPNVVVNPSRRSLLHHYISKRYGGFKIPYPTLGARHSEMFNFFIAMGCELEGRGDLGRTPLLEACVYRQYHMFKSLVGMGANVTTVDYRGLNALHSLLSRFRRLEVEQEKDFREALFIALANGCDPNGLADDYATSPSEYAINSDATWTGWTEALSRFGYILLETEEVEAPNLDLEDFVHVVVSAEHDEGKKLPISNLTLEEWKAERRRILCTINPDTEEDDSVSFQSEGIEGTEEDGNLSSETDGIEDIDEHEDDSD